MDKCLVEVALYSLVDQFNDTVISHKNFCRTFLDQIHPFRDGNGRTCKFLFSDQINNIWTTLVHQIQEYRQKHHNIFWITTFYKSECVLFRYWDELYFYAWRTLLCYQLSFWIGQIALLTMDIFSHMGGMRGSTYKENTMKCRFIKLKYIYKN